MIRPICGPLTALMTIAVVTIAMAQPTKNAPRPTPVPNAPSSDQSNVDIAYEFTQMILAQRGYQANSKSITVSDELLVDTLSMKR